MDFREALGDRLMVGQQPLELRVRVRLLLPQLSHRRKLPLKCEMSLFNLKTRRHLELVRWHLYVFLETDRFYE